jgi:hypothetical protein
MHMNFPFAGISPGSAELQLGILGVRACEEGNSLMPSWSSALPGRNATACGHPDGFFTAFRMTKKSF